MKCLFSILLLACSATALSQPITYQGRIDGLYVPTIDIEAVLYDDPSGGSVVGSPDIVEDVVVGDNLFTTQFDFGSIDFSQPLYLELRIRDGESTDPFAGLPPVLPRVSFTPVPVAYSVINDAVDDADADPGNELQTISFASPNLSISSGNSIDLSALISGLNVDDGDSDDTNELQELSFSEGELTLSDDKTVNISALASSDGDGNAVFVDADGNVGIGTVTPSEQIDFKGLLTISNGLGVATDQQQLTSGFFSFGGGGTKWQSFTPEITGDLTTIHLLSDSIGNDGVIDRYHIYEGQGTDDLLVVTVEAVVNVSSGELIVLDFPTEPSVIAGTQYSVVWEVSNGFNIAGDTGNPYPNGRYSGSSGFDVYFETFVKIDQAQVTFADGSVQTTAFNGLVDATHDGGILTLNTKAFLDNSLYIDSLSSSDGDFNAVTVDDNSNMRVDGDIELEGGTYHAVGFGISNAMVAGRVDSNGDKNNSVTGAGFSSERSSEGIYHIDFDRNFASPPVVTVTVIDEGGTNRFAVIENVTTQGFTAKVRTSGGNADNEPFNFIALGSR